MTSVIVDASVAIKWVVPEIYRPEARSLLAAWNADETDVVVPNWFVCEVSNVLFQRARRGDVTLDGAMQALFAIVREVSIRRDIPMQLAFRAMEIADQLGLRATYDAYYLAMAEHLQCELWTADERFWNSAQATFQQVKWIGNAEILTRPEH